MTTALELAEEAFDHFAYSLDPSIDPDEREVLIAAFECIAKDPAIFARIKDACLAIDGWPAITPALFPKHSRAREVAIAIVEKWPKYLGGHT